MALSNDAAIENHLLQHLIVVHNDLHGLVLEWQVVRLGLLLRHELPDAEIALFQRCPFLLQADQLAVGVVVSQLFLGVCIARKRIQE